jgi:alpha-galactosidase/6-phospho-beta-glucosidase family protein
MSDLEQRVSALRQDIDTLEAALQTTTDEVERAALHMRLNESIRASLRLIDERLQAHNAYLADKHRRASHPSAATTAEREHLQERSVGE